jgi:two-component system, chemotaxis family, chemotaxis protein CheY
MTDGSQRVALVVDDSRAMRSILKRVLAQHDFHVEEAGSGAEALTWLREGKPVSLLLVDLNMPVMSGFELMMEMKTQNLAAGTPVLVCTSEADPASAERAKSLGARGYLTKPIDTSLGRALTALGLARKVA